MQASQREVEATLQKRLDEVSDELRKTQSSYKSLLAEVEKAKGQQQSIAGEDLGSARGELWDRLGAFKAGGAGWGRTRRPGVGLGCSVSVRARCRTGP